jgi:iron complex outermembrane receptor protein
MKRIVAWVKGRSLAASCLMAVALWAVGSAAAEDMGPETEARIAASEAASNTPAAMAGSAAAPIIITATRYPLSLADVPARIDVIAAEAMGQMPAQNVDEVLKNVTGVTAIRTNGIYSVRPLVTLRGLSGDEQGRTLVLKNGVPLNMADTGDVNWNSLDLEPIERIEIFKGPGSSLYGNNAMGGVINVITKKPSEDFSGSLASGYGVFNTAYGNLQLSGRLAEQTAGLYWKASGRWQRSDGYVSAPDDKKNEYTVPRFLDEKAGAIQLGYDFTALRNLELEYAYYDDRRGEGVKIQADEGVARDFDTGNFRLHYEDCFGETLLYANAFHQLQKYQRTSETMRSNTYTRFDVAADRTDYGFLISASHPLGETTTLSSGIEGRFGKVNGQDLYRTSTDVVTNRGAMALYAWYVQNEWNIAENRLKLLGGLRYDYARFYDGYYHISNPTPATNAWVVYNDDDLQENAWSALTPRLSARYFFQEAISAYASLSQGFRASILDDLCRSGYMWVGPKVANPTIGPERIDTYEAGVSVSLGPVVELLPSVYYSRGHQFLYYVATSLPPINGRPVYRRENVGEVEIYGAELDARWSPAAGVSVNAGYTFNRSTILRFEQKPQLEQKELTYNPRHQAHLACDWQNPIVNAYLAVHYKDQQYVKEDNTGLVGEYLTADLKCSRALAYGLSAAISVMNLFDNRFLESDTDRAPGRLIWGEIKWEF